MNINPVPLFGGLIFATVGAYILFDYYRFNKSALKTQGKIIAYDEYLSKNSDGHKRMQYRPHFEYSVNGQRFVVISKASFNSKVIPVGHMAEVLYLRGDEANGRLAKGHGYLLGLIFVGLSAPALYFGLGG
ncbi:MULTISPECIES: DUF3592 domain-containing protein [unclassified Pseudoalteromonas]|uniref:DUF3592 domain-containing protein n=1 Tax=unclassified Pseudoalteromonas TaxID=194690 RepID=UPI001F1F39FE|nr:MULTISPECIES: DUF3592 domain-containing protein [unclassified Pseudoalteromonas]